MDSSALRAANRLRALLREQALLLLLLLTVPLRTVLVLTVPLLTTHHASTYFSTYYLLLTTYYAKQGASPLKLGSGEGRSWGDRAPEDEGGNEPPRFETLTLALTRSNPNPNPSSNPTQVTSHRASRPARSSLPITAHSSLPSPRTSLGWAARTRRRVCNTGRTLPLTLTLTLTLELAGPRQVLLCYSHVRASP